MPIKHFSKGLTFLCTRLGLTVLAGLLSAPNAKAAVEIQKSTDNREVTTLISIDEVQTQNIKIQNYSFTELKLIGADSYLGVWRKVGYPEIPVVRMYVSGDVRVEVVGETSEVSLPSSLKLKPALASTVKKPGVVANLSINTRAYSENAFFGSGESFTIEEAGSIRGQKQKLVTLFPITYNPVTNSYRLVSDFKVISRAIPMARAESSARTGFAFIVGRQFELNSALASYVELKQKMGFQTKIGVVGKDFQNDNQIRAWLKALYADAGFNLKYALLIGDSADVPSHAATNISGVTDHYYRAIDTSDYESDINGPDIDLGRVSVSTATDLEVVLAKFTKYQDATRAINPWLKNLSFLASNDSSHYQVAEGTHDYVTQTHTVQAGYQGFFPNKLSPGGDKLYAISHRAANSNVMEMITEGRAIIDYSGHGAETFWDNPRMSQADVRSLSDTGALPFVISNACVTGHFTKAESFAETWQRHANGAIFFWGSMDSTYWDEDDILERRMFDGIFKGGLREFGKITNYALSQVWLQYGGEGNSKYYWETYVSFGDPSIELRMN